MKSYTYALLCVRFLFSGSVSWWSVMSYNMKLWIRRIKICRLCKIHLKGFIEDETICKSEELNLFMSPSWCYHLTLSHLISSNSLSANGIPTQSYIILWIPLKGIRLSSVRSVYDSFDLDSMWCAFSGETKTTFESLRSRSFYCWNS